MDVDDIKAFLRQRGVTFTERRIDYATQLRTQEKEVFTFYDSGKLVVGGVDPVRWTP